MRIAETGLGVMQAKCKDCGKVLYRARVMNTPGLRYANMEALEALERHECGSPERTGEDVENQP